MSTLIKAHTHVISSLDTMENGGMEQEPMKLTTLEYTKGCGPGDQSDSRESLLVRPLDQSLTMDWLCLVAHKLLVYGDFVQRYELETELGVEPDYDKAVQGIMTQVKWNGDIEKELGINKNHHANIIQAVCEMGNAIQVQWENKTEMEGIGFQYIWSSMLLTACLHKYAETVAINLLLEESKEVRECTNTFIHALFKFVYLVTLFKFVYFDCLRCHAVIGRLYSNLFTLPHCDLFILIVYVATL
jgi:hypothetical protein